jgi:hypothetical protein
VTINEVRDVLETTRINPSFSFMQYPTREGRVKNSGACDRILEGDSLDIQLIRSKP